MATFGKTTVGALTGTISANNKRGYRFQCPETGQATSMSWYGSGAPSQIRLGIYADDNGAPGALLGYTGEITAGSSAGWKTGNLVSPVNLTQGNWYWLCVICNNLITYYYDTGITNYDARNADTYSDGFSDPFGTPTYSNRQMSIYCTYTPGGGLVEIYVDAVVKTSAEVDIRPQTFEISADAIVKASESIFPWVECGDLYENYTTDDWRDYTVFGSTWGAQTFTVGSQQHTVKAVRLKLYRLGNPETLIVSIRAVDANGYPTGEDLTSGSINGNTIPTSPEWIQVVMHPECELNANTTYAIVVRAPNGSNQNWVNWRYAEPGQYPGGIYEYSLDGGNTWMTSPNCDFLFEIWGYAVGGEVHEIYVSAISQSVATPACEATFNISKEASVTSQSLKASETTFNLVKDAFVKVLGDVLVEVVTGIIEIFKDAITTAQALCQTEIGFRISQDALAHALTQTLFELGIARDAIVKASTTSALEVTFTLPLGAVAKADTLSTLKSTFNISQEATIKVLAEVAILKPTEVKITKLYLVMGDLAIQIQGS